MDGLLKGRADGWSHHGHRRLQPWILIKRLGRPTKSNKSEFLDKAVDLQNKLLSLGYEGRVLPQVHKLLGLR